jgi:hypothetical protein
MRRVELVLLLVPAVAAAACSTPNPDDRPIVTAVVGQTGGLAKSADGLVTLQVPAGAVNADVAFTIQQIDAPGPGAIGQVYDLGPAGTVFRGTPATLTFHYRPADLPPPSDPFALRVANFSHGVWQPLQSTVQTVGATVSALIPHLSPWAVVSVDGTGAVVGGADPDAGAAPDATDDASAVGQ